MEKNRVTIWNEYLHEKQDGPEGDWIRQFYPAGLEPFATENPLRQIETCALHRAC